MKLDTQLTPSPQNYAKFNTVIFFLAGMGLNAFSPPANGIWLPLGNCTASQAKSGMKGADVSRNRGGLSTRVDARVVGLAPELDMAINEVRYRKAIPTRIFGTQGADVVQAAVTQTSVTFSQVYQLMSCDTGKRQIANVSVKIGTAAGTAAVENVDYQVDYALGQINIMEGSIPDSTTTTPSAIVVTFDCAALTRASFKAFTTANSYGLLRFFYEDQFGTATENIAYVNLVAGDMGENSNEKYRDDKLTAKILGAVNMFERKD